MYSFYSPIIFFLKNSFLVFFHEHDTLISLMLLSFPSDFCTGIVSTGFCFSCSFLFLSVFQVETLDSFWWSSNIHLFWAVEQWNSNSLIRWCLLKRFYRKSWKQFLLFFRLFIIYFFILTYSKMDFLMYSSVNV